MKQLKHLIIPFLSLLLCTACSETSRQTDSPNIIMILADDLGYSDISCYRNSNPDSATTMPSTAQTPNIDALAGEGLLFTNFYCGAAVCSPSRSALISGRNATRLGIYNYLPENCPMHLRSEEITIAELLKNKAYKTGHFGKWHLTSKGTDQPLPNDQGFDYSFFAYNNALPSHRNPENYYRNGEPVGPLQGYACCLVVDEAIAWLERNKENPDPYYINVWFNEPHLKVAAPEELSSRHAYNQEYYGAIENMDLAVGKLLAYLSEQELDENTIIMFSSDNGSRWDHSNDPFRGEKCFNYEGGLRVPFIIKWPGQIAAGQVADMPGSFTDVLPSLAAITGIPVPSDRVIDGIDLSPVFLGKETSLDREEPLFFYRYFHDPVCMLRDGDWCLLGYQKLIPLAESLDEGKLANIKPWYFMEDHMEYLKTQVPILFELYNLKLDREQEHDVSAQYPERLETMKAKMLSLREEMVEEGGDWYASQPATDGEAEKN